MTTAMEEATIYALGTPAPSRAAPGAVSVIRLSGPRAPEALIFLTEPKAFERGYSARDPSLPEPRRMVVRGVLDPATGEEIDRGLVVWFEAPHTETGEMMAELHLHGGRAVVNAALAAIARLGFCRLAEPGEFTRRAFEHGKLDLTRAEAIADVRGDHAFGRDARTGAGGLGAELDAQQFLGLGHVAIGLGQGLLAHHHRRVGLGAQFSNHACGNRGHLQTPSLRRPA